MFCYQHLKETWSIVEGAATGSQWSPRFVPYNISIKPDDSESVVTSVLGGNYLFVQPINIYASTDFIDFSVRVNLRDGSFKALRDFLDDRGTYKAIALKFPFDLSPYTKWLQVSKAPFSQSSGTEYVASISLRNDAAP